MRDTEFINIYTKLVPRLEAYFHACLKNENYPKPYKGTIHYLRKKTVSDAFLNSRKDSLSGWTIEALIWIKAKNVWHEFANPHKTIVAIDEVIDFQSSEPDPLYLVLVKEKLEIIKSKTDSETWKIVEMRANGFSYSEIANSLQEKEVNVKMKIHRLKKRLESEI